MRSLQMILSRKPTPNTYKFAVIRALADCIGWRRFSGSDPIVSGVSPEVLSFEQIAAKIVRFYWPIVTYRLRQSIDSADEPNVMQLIREETAALALTTHFDSWSHEQKYPERHKALVSRCCDPGGSLIKAISRLNTIIFFRVDPKLYEVRGKELHLTAGAVEFLIRYKQEVEQLSIAWWVTYTEQLTTSPRLHAKISGAAGGGGGSALWNENDKRKYSRILGELWGDICFYCGRPPHDAPLAVGHVVPITYVHQTRIWNLVLNCDACSAAKGEQTPPNSCVEELIERNRQLVTLIQRSNAGLGNREIHELNHFGSRIAEHVLGLIESCRADGFGTWSGPESMPSG
jgi:hypothetical protein